MIHFIGSTHLQQLCILCKWRSTTHFNLSISNDTKSINRRDMSLRVVCGSVSACVYKLQLQCRNNAESKWKQHFANCSKCIFSINCWRIGHFKIAQLITAKAETLWSCDWKEGVLFLYADKCFEPSVYAGGETLSFAFRAKLMLCDRTVKAQTACLGKGRKQGSLDAVSEGKTNGRLPSLSWEGSVALCDITEGHWPYFFFFFFSSKVSRARNGCQEWTFLFSDRTMKVFKCLMEEEKEKREEKKKGKKKRKTKQKKKVFNANS